jgi:WD40 repeat protein
MEFNFMQTVHSAFHFTCIDWSVNLNFLAAGTNTGYIYAWDLENDDAVWDKANIVSKGRDCIISLKWSNSSRLAAGTSNGAQIAYFSYPDWWLRRRLPKHTSAVLSVAWNVEGRNLFKLSNFF